ncbi:hypothetical protein ACHWQZ_G016861 [Mnemiopsis leidyi]
MPPKVTRGAASKRGAAAVGRGQPASRGKTAVRGSRGAARGARGGAKPVTKKKPEKPKWTDQEIKSAIIIQKAYRGYRQRKIEEDAKKKKEEMDRLMEEAERAAWLKVIKLEKEREDREHEKWLKQERERKAHLKRMKMMLENAFDGELGDIQQILQEAKIEWEKSAGEAGIHPTKLARKTMELLECTDANEYTPMSEAAAGGASEVIEWLVSQGANPNSIGRYGRSPLYRAAFAGHVEAVQMCLQCGADPRLRADDGCSAGDISTNPIIKEILREWDVSDTERLLSNLQLEQEKRANAQAEYAQLKCDAIQDQINAAEEEFKQVEKQLMHAYDELNKRIYEHDMCVLKGTHVEVTLQTVHDAEDLVTVLKVKVDDSRRALQLLRLQLREEKKEKEEAQPVGVQIVVKELEDVLIRDVGNRMSEDGRWPLIIDETGQASIFVRYSDTNYLNSVNPSNMEPERMRIALLGAVRYGKPLVIDMMGCDMFHVIKGRFDEIKEGLLDWILDKTLVTEEKFNMLTKPEDGPEYEEKKFWARMEDFKFWLMTNSEPEPEILDKFYVIRVKPSPPKH